METAIATAVLTAEFALKAYSLITLSNFIYSLQSFIPVYKSEQQANVKVEENS